ncbi:DUF418 domain-containing protein [Altererythrobacter sp.]|uniref:DUF418 domain-containing protein n=1 Tax=Altererythrobacter sp. TaxID=1872480 RepID=UPI003D06DEF1
MPASKISSPSSDRIELVDALRGYALLGLLLVHCVERFELYWLDPQPDAWFDGVFALFGGKSFAIFALLFGFGFATIMANYRRRDIDFTWRFAWRVTLLFAIGTLHALIYRGDILQVLALLGLLLIPLDRISSNRILAILAALLLIQVPLLAQSVLAGNGSTAAQTPPYFLGDTGLSVLAQGSFTDVLTVNAQGGMVGKWSFYLSTGRIVEICGLFAIGMLLQRKKAFMNLPQSRLKWSLALAVSGLTWLVLDRYGPGLLPPWPDQGGAPMQAQSVGWALDSWRTGAATAFQIAVFVLLWQTPVHAVLRWFAPPGRMTLTFYVLQSLVSVPLFYGFGSGLWDDWSTAQTVLAGLVFFALQIVAATWWYRHFRYGPLEWTWRAMTLGDRNIPIRRSK